MLLTGADVEKAVAELAGVIRRTPMIASRVLSERTGADVWLKCENLQRTGSFKPRGAYLRILRLSESERARGVVAASAGNHAQGVAWSATELGIASRVYMPEGRRCPRSRRRKPMARRSSWRVRPSTTPSSRRSGMRTGPERS